MFPQDIEDNLRELARRIDAINTARPGPTSWGPGDGEASAIADDGRTLFSFGSTGASVEFRGALTGLTSHLESQDTRMTNERADRIAVDNQLDGRITSERSDRIAVQAQLVGMINDEASDREAADSALSGQIASERADRIAVDQSLSGRITTAQSRADAAYQLADDAVTQGELVSAVNGLMGTITTLSQKVQTIENWLTAHTEYPNPPLG